MPEPIELAQAVRICTPTAVEPQLHDLQTLFAGSGAIGSCQGCDIALVSDTESVQVLNVW